MREKWTDERLDYLNAKVDDLGRRMDFRFDSVDRRFERIDNRIDTLTWVTITGFLTLAGLIVGLPN